MALRIAFFSLIVLCMALLGDALSLSAAEESGQTFVLLRGDISVSAVLTESIEKADIPPFYSFIILIKDARRRYEVQSNIIAVGDLNDALNVLRKSICTKGDYTFVRHECGGGNGWRCNVDSIFAIRQGVLNWVGDMAGEERGAAGHNYSDGLFMDYYDKFEINPLTSHADAPGLKIYSRDHKGALHVDLDITWRRNLGVYREEKQARDLILQKSAVSEEWRELLAILLSEAVAAKYCGRTRELEEAQQIAERSFSADIVKDFDEILRNVIPGELPKTRVKRTR